ncbi:Zinc finger protein 64 like protein, isoforms 1 and 2 [Willisornis vidua]|uniref:Zinc finger protein 64 like protein, isoforms 1 and 2 n=1 Tax=Willisornis vidua TaxID=1566151 RepID=A0ABQ9D668_9PASS|nr:Zinc finger protein 64 like protein, isoforms 1 and 2 [Willisornis vidua]
MNGGAAGAAPSFPGPVQFPGGTTVLVELTPDIHICGICKQQFNNLDAFVGHKQSGCQLTSATAGATSTVQFVSEETVPSTQAQSTTRTIASETQTITVSAPEFVFEHGYQTYLPSESSEPPAAAAIPTPPKARPKKSTSSLTQKKLNCCYPGDKPHKCELCSKCFSRKDKLKMHMRCHTGVKPYKCKHCEYAAADSSSLNKHQRIHSNERPFKCQICPYASRNSSQLTVHLRSHTGDAPFQCQMCPAKFKINSDLKRHLRVHSGEKPYKCEFCDVRCAMKGNLKSHIRIKHSMENTLKCPECEFQCGNKTSLRHHIRTHQPEQPVKCSECNYSCSNKAALKVHERIHCKDRPFKCEFCSFDTKQRSNLTTHIRKAHGDKVKTKKQSMEKKEGDRPKQGGSRQVAKLDAKKAFKCDLCDASFVREDSLRSHKKQHSLYNGSKANELAVLQLQMDPSRQSSAPITVSHLQVPLQPAQVSPYNEGRVKIIVGHQVPQTNSIVQAASVNVVPPALVSQGQEELPATSRLQLLGQVSLVAPAAPAMATGDQCASGAVAQPAVLLTTHDQGDGNALHQALIPAAPVGSHEAAASQAFITSSGISCSDLEGLNALIQEGATEVTVVSDGGQSITVSTAAPPPPIFSSSSHTEAPKQTYSIIQSGAHTALLCPADSIPD